MPRMQNKLKVPALSSLFGYLHPTFSSSEPYPIPKLLDAHIILSVINNQRNLVSDSASTPSPVGPQQKFSEVLQPHMYNLPKPSSVMGTIFEERVLGLPPAHLLDFPPASLPIDFQGMSVEQSDPECCSHPETTPTNFLN